MKHIIIANWKMNFSLKEAQEFCSKLLLEDYKDLIIAPPQLHLSALANQFKELTFASQDVSSLENNFGAFTGEVSAYMLARESIKYTITGHSERREFFNENNKLINTKARNCIKNGIVPIICIGETLKERLSNNYWQSIKMQLEGSLDLLTDDFIIAYEPLWAIGSNISVEINQLEEIANYINDYISFNILNDNYKNGKLEKKIKLIYGGSVTSKNIKNLIKTKGIDGFLIGKASLNFEEFIKICKFKD